MKILLDIVEPWRKLRVLFGTNGRLLICGDFNARSVHWGCHTNNRRGFLLEDWVLELNLEIVNHGNVPTCVRPQGSSVIDLTVALSWVASNVRDWGVKANMEIRSFLRVVFVEHWLCYNKPHG